jgi:hypothetical protein
MPMSETEPTEPAEPTEPTEPTQPTQPTQALSDLEAVQRRIEEAHAAEEHLLAVMPGAIKPEDDAHEGVTGPTEGDVERTDASAETDTRDDAAQAEPS